MCQSCAHATTSGDCALGLRGCRGGLFHDTPRPMPETIGARADSQRGFMGKALKPDTGHKTPVQIKDLIKAVEALPRPDGIQDGQHKGRIGDRVADDTGKPVAERRSQIIIQGLNHVPRD